MVLSQPCLLCFSRERRGASTWLQRALVLEQLSPALRSTNFSCVFTDPEQIAQHHIVLAQLWVRSLRKGFQRQEELCSSMGQKGWVLPQAASPSLVPKPEVETKGTVV